MDPTIEQLQADTARMERQLEWACWTENGNCRGCLTANVIARKGQPLGAHDRQCWVLRILKGTVA